MIHRQNWLDVKKHLDYRLRVLQNEKQTVRAAWVSLRHVLEWADDIPFNQVEKIKLTFPEYILTASNDVNHPKLSPKYMQKCIDNARYFFTWARQNLPGYSKISSHWIETLHLRKSKSVQSRLTTRSIWTLEDVRKVLAVDTTREKKRFYNTDTIRFDRDKAALAFLFLSGMRIGAFSTLPIACVDITRRRIKQLPEMGVHTKNSKAAITFLLPISDLLEVVISWDRFLRDQDIDDRCHWYTRLTPNGESIDKNDLVEIGENYQGRYSAFTQGLHDLCDMAGIPYKSPHKIRHGFGVLGVKRARNMAELKAISQNLMHQNIGITDGIYGRLPEDDVNDLISSMFEGDSQ